MMVKHVHVKVLPPDEEERQAEAAKNNASARPSASQGADRDAASRVTAGHG